MDAQEGTTTEALIASVLPHAGEEGMRKLMALFGGTEIQIPIYATSRSPLVQALGTEIAEKIHRDLRVVNADGRAVGRARFYVPNRAFINTAQKIQEMLRAGATVKDIRLSTGVSERTIRKYRAQLAHEQAAKIGGPKETVKRLAGPSGQLGHSTAALDHTANVGEMVPPAPDEVAP